MLRIACIVAQGYPYHVTHRGNNQSATFFDDEDRQAYLKLHHKYSTQPPLQIWDYCVMDKLVNLLRGDFGSGRRNWHSQIYSFDSDDAMTVILKNRWWSAF